MLVRSLPPRLRRTVHALVPYMLWYRTCFGTVHALLPYSGLVTLVVRSFRLSRARLTPTPPLWACGEGMAKQS